MEGEDGRMIGRTYTCITAEAAGAVGCFFRLPSPPSPSSGGGGGGFSEGGAILRTWPKSTHWPSQTTFTTKKKRRENKTKIPTEM